jgi:cell division protein ZapA (FtsZ GTPase activity inhibitor)
MKRKVDVTLLGHRFTVRSEKEEAYVHALAGFVSKRVEEVRRQMRNCTPHEAALLTALHLADELFEQAERNSSTRAEVRRRTESLIEKLTTALAEDGDADARAEDAPAEETVAALQR